MEGKFGLDTRHIPYVANTDMEKKIYLKATGSIFGPNVGKLRETQTKNSKMKRSKKRTFATLMERPGKWRNL